MNAVLTPPPAGLRMPAETEPQQAVLLASPSGDYKAGWSVLQVQARMIRELIATVPVIYLHNGDASDETQALGRALLALGVPQALIERQLRFMHVPHADAWVRDCGGLFLSDGCGERQVVALDFDGYGYAPFGGEATRRLYAADRRLAQRVAAALGLPARPSPLVCEGGNLHFNGRGVVVAVETGLLPRNPGWSRARIEEELRRLFRQQQVIWLPRNLATDAHAVLQTPYTVNGEPVYNLGVTHVDEMIAWVDERTLLLPEVGPDELAAAVAAGDPIVPLNHAVLSEAHAILSQARDADGRPFDIVRVPEPGTILFELGPEDAAYRALADLDHHPQIRLAGAERLARGEPVQCALPASYMNFVVTDGLVLVPSFHQPGRDASLAPKDEAFRRIVAARYPGRRVVQIDVDAVLAGGGGMHCITQQIPR